MWSEETPFRTLMPSKIRYDDDMAQDPEATNQITRLEILNLLAITRARTAEAAIKNFLKQKKWGISAMAATLLLSEGDETALTLVQNLLTDAMPLYACRRHWYCLYGAKMRASSPHCRDTINALSAK